MLNLLELTGNDEIPLHIGARRPLANTSERAKVQREFLGGLTYLGAFAEPEPMSDADLEPPSGGAFAELRPRSQDAVSFIIDTIDRHSGEVTILALGPMTNVAMALNLRPDLASKIESLVFMGGALRVPGNTSPYAEFNFWFDPEAAQQVLRSAIPEKVMFGLDITNRAPSRRLSSTPSRQPGRQSPRSWSKTTAARSGVLPPIPRTTRISGTAWPPVISLTPSLSPAKRRFAWTSTRRLVRRTEPPTSRPARAIRTSRRPGWLSISTTSGSWLSTATCSRARSTLRQACRAHDWNGSAGSVRPRPTFPSSLVRASQQTRADLR